MKRSYIISDYCSIRKNLVAIRDNIVYTSSDSDFRGFSNDIYKNFALSYPKFHKMDNLSKLGFLSTELLLSDKNLNNKYSGDEVGVILMNASSSIDTDRNHQNTISNRENYFPSPSIFVYTLPNVVIGEICIRHKFCGEGIFFISEKFNPYLLVSYADQLLDSETIKCCIAGWIEFDGNDFESMVFLIEKSDKPDVGIVKFEPSVILGIYEK
jgi:3-oxoacyl-(acyl-carrier-protein) synthase